MEPLELIFEPLPSESLTRLLTDNVINNNYAKTGISDGHPVGYFLKNARGEWLGGLTGYIWGGWLHVNFVWVTEMLRGQGHGSRLMDAAETFAAERGAFAATLETHSFKRQTSIRSVATLCSVVSTIIRWVTPNYSCASASMCRPDDSNRGSIQLEWMD